MPPTMPLIKLKKVPQIKFLFLLGVSTGRKSLQKRREKLNVELAKKLRNLDKKLNVRLERQLREQPEKLRNMLNNKHRNTLTLKLKTS